MSPSFSHSFVDLRFPIREHVSHFDLRFPIRFLMIGGRSWSNLRDLPGHPKIMINSSSDGIFDLWLALFRSIQQ